MPLGACFVDAGTRRLEDGRILRIGKPPARRHDAANPVEKPVSGRHGAPQVRQLEMRVGVDERRKNDGLAEVNRVGLAADADPGNLTVLDGDPSIRHRVVNNGKDPVGSIDRHARVSDLTCDPRPSIY